MSDSMISGLYEIAIGITSEDEKKIISYWEKFGFTVTCFGNLDAVSVNNLYGVDSNLRSLRFQNQVREGMDIAHFIPNGADQHLTSNEPTPDKRLVIVLNLASQF